MPPEEYSSLVESYIDYKNLIYTSSDVDSGMKTRIRNMSRFVPMYTEIRFDAPGNSSTVASMMSISGNDVTPCDTIFAFHSATSLLPQGALNNYIESLSLEIERSQESTRKQ